MIDLKQPSLALHAADVPGYRYKMWATWEVPKTLPVPSIVEWISYAVDRSPELRLANVVLNSHGYPAWIGMGTGIDQGNVGLFSKLRTQSIGCIWIVACLVGAKKYKDYVANGPYFCSSLAKTTGTFVVAADVEQYVSPGYEVYARLPFTKTGNIDDFEGVLTRYDPAGGKKVIGNNGAGLWD